MINLRRNFYLLAATTTLMLIIAAVCALAENTMDIFFLGAGVFLSVLTFRTYDNLREEKRLRS